MDGGISHWIEGNVEGVLDHWIIGSRTNFCCLRFLSVHMGPVTMFLHHLQEHGMNQGKVKQD